MAAAQPIPRGEYVPTADQRVVLLPNLDLALLLSFLDHPTATQAVRAFRAALTGAAPSP